MGSYLTLDALTPGDVVCLNASGLVLKALPSVLLALGRAFGVCSSTTAAGASATIQTVGAIPAAVTGLSALAGFVRVSATARCELVASLGVGDYAVGSTNASGLLTLDPRLAVSTTTIIAIAPLYSVPGTPEQIGLDVDALGLNDFIPETEADVPTTGSSGIYGEATATGVVSSIDPGTIANLTYDRCHDTGHAAPGKLIPLILLPGWGSDKSEFSQTTKRRYSSYVDPTTGKAFLVICPSTRGRGSVSGSIDHARDTYDILDCLDHAIAAVGADVDGTSAVVVGYSTGSLGALLFASKFPDRCRGCVCFYPNYDLGKDTNDSYWAVRSDLRSILISWVGDRSIPGAENLDPYLVRNAIESIGQIVALPGGPRLWIFGDRDETEPLPDPERLVRAAQAFPGATSKVYPHITQIGDPHRYLHALPDVNADIVYAERFFAPIVLQSEEWALPQRSPWPLRVLGYLRSRAWELWLGSNDTPKASAGQGRTHTADLQYDDSARRYHLESLAHTDGYVEVIRGSDDVSEPLIAGALHIVDLDVVGALTGLGDLGFTRDYDASVGASITQSGGLVSSWADAIGGSNAFVEASAKPAYVADSGGGKPAIRFTAGSSHKLVLSSALFDPTQDFTLLMVVKKTTAADALFFAVSHHGNFSEFHERYTSGSHDPAIVNSAGSILAEAGQSGFTQNVRHVLMVQRAGTLFRASLDGGTINEASISAGTFTNSAPMTTSMGCAWADGGGAYWQFFDGDIHEIASKQGTISDGQIASAVAFLQTKWAV